MRKWMVALLVATLVACGGEEAPEADTEAVVAEPAGGMGMEGMQMGGGMMEQMHLHMQQMEDASGEQLRASLPQHRQLVANMIAQMNREMSEMRMEANPDWSALVDLIRQDLVRLPEMTLDELAGYMPEHRARVMRLMEMHRQMMAGMQM